MTCLEKFRQEYPNIPVERILNVYCPHVSGEIYDMPEPDYCPGKNGTPECRRCWNREIPGMENALLSVEEMKRKLAEYCQHTPNCVDCNLLGFDCAYQNDVFSIPEDQILKAHEAAFGESPEPASQPTEAVNHPKHYVREGAMECIDEMLLVFGKEATMNFCLLNAWKYRYRASAKGGEEDLKKSDWYLAVYADLKGGD